MNKPLITKISLPIVFLFIVLIITWQITANKTKNSQVNSNSSDSSLVQINQEVITKDQNELQVIGQEQVLGQEVNKEIDSLENVPESQPFPDQEQFDEFGQQIIQDNTTETVENVKLINNVYLSEFRNGKSSGKINDFNTDSQIVLVIELTGEKTNNNELIIKTVNKGNSQVQNEMTTIIYGGEIGMVNPRQSGQYDVQVLVSSNESYNLSFTIN